MIVGLDNAGKTSLLYKMNLGEVEVVVGQSSGQEVDQIEESKSVIETTPTIGANVERVKIGKVEMECWDLGRFYSVLPFVLPLAYVV